MTQFDYKFPLKFIVDPRDPVAALRLLIRHLEVMQIEIKKAIDENTIYVPASITVNTGTETGTVADVQTILDGNTLDVEEAAGTPGFDVEFGFTNVYRLPRLLVFKLLYAGSASHGVGIDLYNYSTTTWDRFTSFSTHLGQTYIPVQIPDATNYVSSGYAANARLYHFSGGNASHDIYIDYVGLIRR